MEVYTGTFNKGVDLKCSACAIGFAAEKEYKEHYKSEFHRYNIKRRSINLPPASHEQYLTKKKDVVKEEVEQKICGVCKKVFNSQATYDQHITSKKHQPKQGSITEKSERKSSMTSDIKVRDNSELQCLFCNRKQKTLEQNLNHMKRIHSFFISEEAFCINKIGLIKYLNEKIDVGIMCIYCENKGTRDFVTGEAVRNHMKDRGHCFMKTDEGFEEYEKFYDFSKLFDEKLSEQKNYKKLAGIEEDIIEVQEDGKKENKNDDDDEWEDDDDDQEEEINQQGSNKVEKDGTKLQQVIEQKKVKTVKYTIFKPTITKHQELLLPSGKLLGHRKYKHLYKQYYRPHYIDVNLKRILGPSYTGTYEISKRYFEVEHQKKEIALRLRPAFHRRDVTELNQKIKQNRLQYHFRVQNPK